MSENCERWGSKVNTIQNSQSCKTQRNSTARPRVHESTYSSLAIHMQMNHIISIIILKFNSRNVFLFMFLDVLNKFAPLENGKCYWKELKASALLIYLFEFIFVFVWIYFESFFSSDFFIISTIYRDRLCSFLCFLVVLRYYKCIMSVNRKLTNYDLKCFIYLLFVWSL